MEKCEALVLVGLPGSGKSTWARRHPENYDIASTDDLILDFARTSGRSYEECFGEFYPRAVAMMKDKVEDFIRERKPFIWDQTNLSREERSAIYRLLQPTHRVVFVAFLVPLDVCLERNRKRKADRGQSISEDRIRMLAETATFPDDTEPFDRIVRFAHPQWKNRKEGVEP